MNFIIFIAQGKFSLLSQQKKLVVNFMLKLMVFLSLFPFFSLFSVLSLYFPHFPFFFLDELSDSVLSGLSFVSVNCEESYFPGGVSLQNVWFEVSFLFGFIWFYLDFLSNIFFFSFSQSNYPDVAIDFQYQHQCSFSFS